MSAQKFPVLAFSGRHVCRRRSFSLQRVVQRCQIALLFEANMVAKIWLRRLGAAFWASLVFWNCCQPCNIEPLFAKQVGQPWTRAVPNSAWATIVLLDHPSCKSANWQRRQPLGDSSRRSSLDPRRS